MYSRARLGRDPFTPNAGPLATVLIARERGALPASVVLSASDGAQIGDRDSRATTDDCAGLTASVAVALILALGALPLRHRPRRQAMG
ncbi:MAG: hypothetical protein WCJ30_10800 [Deltaproteobacteria bacterium]